MAAPSKWIVYNRFKFRAGQAAFDLDGGNIKIALYKAFSRAIDRTINPATYTEFRNDDLELQTANGYTRKGASPSSWGVTLAGGIVVFDTAPVSWAATGDGLLVRAAVIYDDATANGDAIAYCLLDSTPTDITVPAGFSLTISPSQILRIQRTL